MPLSDEQLQEERRKAKHLAMLQALEMIERSPTNQLCSSCASWQEKYSRDSRQYCQDISHLRNALQAMINKLTVFISAPCLQAFVDSLQLDPRLFKVGSVDECFKPQDGCMEKKDMRDELSSQRKDLEEMTSERDLAKMKIGVLGRELSELKSAHKQLELRAEEQSKADLVRKRRLEKAEARIQALEQQCASPCPSPSASSPVQSQALGSPEPSSKDLASSSSRKLRRRIDLEHCSSKASDGLLQNTEKHDELWLRHADSRIEALEAQCNLLETKPQGGQKHSSRLSHRPPRMSQDDRSCISLDVGGAECDNDGTNQLGGQHAGMPGVLRQRGIDSNGFVPFSDVLENRAAKASHKVNQPMGIGKADRCLMKSVRSRSQGAYIDANNVAFPSRTPTSPTGFEHALLPKGRSLQRSPF